MGTWSLRVPDPREDLESRSPNLGPYTTKGALQEPPLRDLLFGSSRGSRGLGNWSPRAALSLHASSYARSPRAPPEHSLDPALHYLFGGKGLGFRGFGFRV